MFHLIEYIFKTKFPQFIINYNKREQNNNKKVQPLRFELN